MHGTVWLSTKWCSSDRLQVELKQCNCYKNFRVKVKSSMYNNVSQEKINFFRENGFVQFDDVIIKEELIDLREYLGQVMGAENGKFIQSLAQNSAYAKVLNQRFNTWADSPGMAAFAFHRKFSKMALDLAGYDQIRFFHDHG